MGKESAALPKRPRTACAPRIAPRAVPPPLGGGQNANSERRVQVRGALLLCFTQMEVVFHISQLGTVWRNQCPGPRLLCPARWLRSGVVGGAGAGAVGVVQVCEYEQGPGNDQ